MRFVLRDQAAQKFYAVFDFVELTIKNSPVLRAADVFHTPTNLPSILLEPFDLRNDVGFWIVGRAH
jgi:hypothetical protein